MIARKPTSFRLSPEALASLESLASSHAIRRSDVLEWLLTGVMRTRQRGAREHCGSAVHGKGADVRSAVQLARAAHALLQMTEGEERALVQSLIIRAHALVAAEPSRTVDLQVANTIDMGIPQKPAAVPHPRLIAMLLPGGSDDHS